MWHEESAATKASSGSMPEGSAVSAGTCAAGAEAGRSSPPSNRQRWARLHRCSRKGESRRSQSSVDVYAAMETSCPPLDQGALPDVSVSVEWSRGTGPYQSWQFTIGPRDSCWMITIGFWSAQPESVTVQVTLTFCPPIVP